MPAQVVVHPRRATLCADTACKSVGTMEVIRWRTISSEKHHNISSLATSLYLPRKERDIEHYFGTEIEWREIWAAHMTI